ncbi:hypothetical protein RHGRI_015900 [Rhododendron griersonianum]|uniref:HTH La-type RNA-binding domain-containing protein n=1 Tax=Rhododendron griersonianum TaxID=479676 RepID=A0AAV6JTC9_9ERIC|nr:hypothetical protein RHGRI_015900 [Rhododendron griersonianum]
MAQLVRGEQEPVSPQPEEATSPGSSSASKETYHEDSDGNHSNVGHPKKPAWSKPLNGVVSVGGPVMGDAVSWPALSEATKAPSKSTPDFSPSESIPASQAKTDSSNSIHNQKKHSNTNSNPNSTTNPKSPRQRSSKRGGGTRPGPVQNGFIRAPLPPPPMPLPPPPPIFPVFEIPYGALPPVPDYFPYNGSNWEGMPMGSFVPPSNSVNYQSSPRNSSRRGNFGGHHNGRNASRSSNVRDARVPQQIAPPRGFLRPAPPPPPPPGSIPFLRPHSVGPFGYPMGFDMPFPFVYVPTPPLESFNEVPFAAQAPPMPPLPSTVLDDTMRASLINQIDYYFCDDNLSRDDFLRSKMDEEGWVPISLIAGFPKVNQVCSMAMSLQVQQWTKDIELIIDSLKASSVVEVQPYKVRRRDEWKKWVCTPSRFAAGSGFQSTMGSTEKTITSSLLKVTLDEAAANESSIMSEADSSAKVVPRTSKSEEFTGHSNLANGETMIEASCSSHI